jgi:hypothetical protein
MAVIFQGEAYSVHKVLVQHSDLPDSPTEGVASRVCSDRDAALGLIMFTCTMHELLATSAMLAFGRMMLSRLSVEWAFLLSSNLRGTWRRVGFASDMLGVWNSSRQRIGEDTCSHLTCSVECVSCYNNGNAGSTLEVEEMYLVLLSLERTMTAG